jgi:hypothetical protein
MPGLAVASALAIALACAPTTTPTTSTTPGTSPPASASSSAAAVGAHAPAAQLTRTSGEKVALLDLLRGHTQTVVVFYRGFW